MTPDDELKVITLYQETLDAAFSDVLKQANMSTEAQDTMTRAMAIASNRATQAHMFSAQAVSIATRLLDTSVDDSCPH